jgi:hypothetical protein
VDGGGDCDTGTTACPASDGLLDNYRVLYLVGDNLTRDAAVQIAGWVRAGGCLFRDAGSGLRDEDNEPLTTLEPVFGITESRLTKIPASFPARKQFLGIKAQDQAEFGASDVFPAATTDVLVGYQEEVTLTPAARVLATFAGKKTPVAWLSRYGQGTVLSFAFLPGYSYEKAAPPELHGFWHVFPAHVVSVQRRKLRFRETADGLTFTLPLDRGDIIELPRRRP